MGREGEPRGLPECWNSASSERSRGGQAELERSQCSLWAHLPGVQPLPAARQLLPGPGHGHRPHSGLGHGPHRSEAGPGQEPAQPCWYQRAPGATPPAGSCSRDILLVAAGDRGVLSSEPCHGHGRRWECRLLSPLPSQDGVFTPLCPAQRAGGGERKPLIKHSPALPRPEESKVHPQSTER